MPLPAFKVNVSAAPPAVPFVLPPIVIAPLPADVSNAVMLPSTTSPVRLTDPAVMVPFNVLVPVASVSAPLMEPPVPLKVSAPASPSTEPVSAAPILNISLPDPPFRSAVVTAVMLNVSTSVPPCNVPKPLKVNTGLPPRSSYVLATPNIQVLATSSPVNIPVPVNVSMLLNPPDRLATVAKVPV